MGIKSMKMWFENFPNQGEKFVVPVNPLDSFKININNKFETTNVFGLGEVILKRNSSLKTFGWRSFFPMNEDDALVFTGDNSFKTQSSVYCEWFRKAIEENQIITFVIILYDDNNSIIPYINKEVIIKDFNTDDRGGEPGDIYYTINLTEYKEPIIVESVVTPTPIVTSGNNNGSTTTYKEPLPNKSPQPKDKFSVGNVVIVNGYLYELSPDVDTTSKAALSSKVLSDKTYFQYITDIKTSSLGIVGNKYFMQGGLGTIRQLKKGYDAGDGSINSKSKVTNEVEFVKIQLSQPLERSLVSKIISIFTLTSVSTSEYSKVTHAWVRKDKCVPYSDRKNAKLSSESGGMTNTGTGGGGR